MIKIKIPATSANLGAGFDSLGLAVNLYNYVYMEESDTTLRFHLEKITWFLFPLKRYMTSAGNH